MVQYPNDENSPWPWAKNSLGPSSVQVLIALEMAIKALTVRWVDWALKTAEKKFGWPQEVSGGMPIISGVAKNCTVGETARYPPKKWVQDLVWIYLTILEPPSVPQVVICCDDFSPSNRLRLEPWLIGSCAGVVNLPGLLGLRTDPSNGKIGNPVHNHAVKGWYVGFSSHCSPLRVLIHHHHSRKNINTGYI